MLNGSNSPGYLQLGSLPALYPEWLGERSFLEVHRVRYPYVLGAMYRALTSTDMVIAAARANLLAFFGAAGLAPAEVEAGLNTIRNAVGDTTQTVWGSNLIHSPEEPALEEAVVDMYLRYGVDRVSASAFMTMSKQVVRYSASGLQLDANGFIQRRNHVFAKLSRCEIAEMFMSPAPPQILGQLVAEGKLTQQEADLASRVAVAEDITVEADSGGHTDNRPLVSLLPTVLKLRDELAAKHQFTRPIRVGAAGGIGTPGSAASAFAMGAAYVLTGSINQSAIESGMSDEGRAMLADAGVADVAMAPAADMFELGVKAQVLKRGTMFPNRAAQLYRIYSENASIDTIPAKTRAQLEKDLFHATLEEIWGQTKQFFSERDPAEVEKAEANPKRLMGLVFRWYLGNSANWAMRGHSERKLDYQIHTGPSIGAFNAWVKGSFLEPVENRNVVDIALNILEGAAVVSRAAQVRSYGVPVPSVAFDYRPRPLAQGPGA